MVHSGVRWLVRSGLGLRLPARGLAVWSGRGDLVGGGRPPLVFGKEMKAETYLVRGRGSELVQPVEGRHLVSFRQCRIIEHGIPKIFDGCAHG